MFFKLPYPLILFNKKTVCLAITDPKNMILETTKLLLLIALMEIGFVFGVGFKLEANAD